MGTLSWSIPARNTRCWLKQTNVWILPLLLCWGMLIDRVQSQGLSVIGPKSIRPYSTYSVVIGNSLNQLIRLSITLESEDLNFTKQTHVQRKSCTTVPIIVGNITSGDYMLIAKSVDRSFSFDQRVELAYEPKSMSVFIQTNKPVYTPGDTVRFRVIAVDADTRPVTTIKTLSKMLEDSEGTSIRKWPFAQLKNGVFQSEVKLASSPNLGNWTIYVDATQDVRVTKQIEIKEYVLPKFFVKVYPSQILLVKDKKVSLTLEISYTFNEPVDGKYVVKLFLDPNRRKPDFEKRGLITGRKSLEFELQDEVDLDGDDQYFDVTVNVVVIETFSNRTVNVTELVPIYLQPYVVTILPSIPSFRPGLPYDLKIVVEDHLGRPPQLDGDKKSIQIEAEFQLHGGTETKSITVNLDKKGEGRFTLTPNEDAEALTMTATYDSEEYDKIHNLINGVVSQSKQYLKVTLNPKYIKNVKVNREIRLDITCTETMTHLFYIVITRGSIVKASSTAVNRRKYSLKLKMTEDMSPNSTVLVYYNNKEYLVFDFIELKFNAFNNEFRFDLDKKEYFPGQEVEIDVYASNDSYVAFSGIDQSVLLVRNGQHDISREDVLNELALYGATQQNEFDTFHTRGLFLRSTAIVDTPVSRSQNARYGDTEVRRRRPIEIRRRFYESWLWTDFSMDGQETFKTIRDSVPDTITTYQVSGFALSPTLGLGVVSQPVSFIVKKQFYLVANLPYSIKRGEVASIQVTVFNFLGNDVKTDVKLFNKRDEIEFVDKASTDNTYRSKEVISPTNKGKSVSFMVKAKKLGLIAIKIVASSGIANDALEHMLRVTPESRRVEDNVARFIELPTYSKQTSNFTLYIPSRHDEGSIEIKFTLDPDILGKAIENLHELIRKPTGCGEQNMINFVPNIVVLDYLSETRTDNEEVRSKAIDFLSSGYQNQLRYKRSDGSFSVWGESDQGSTFLTAFVAKSLKIAAKYIDVDKSVTNAAFDWLAKQQTLDGRFPEVGQIIIADMQGGISSNNFALTAYVLIAFAENEDVFKQYKSELTKTTNYLANNLDNMPNAYELSLATYGLMLAKHRKRHVFLDKLVEISTVSEDRTERYWDQAPVSVEATAYALLSYIAENMVVESTLMMRWLNKQRYGRGGYSGTQDTFVGLKALATFAAKSSVAKNDYRVTLKYKPNVHRTFDIDKHVPLTTQELDIPSHIRNVQVEIEGVGYGYFQLWHQYYQNIQVLGNRFKIKINQLNTTNANVQKLDVCVNYESPETYNRSSMALVEIFLPSGFTADADSITDTTGRIKNIERRFADTSIVVYYDNMGSELECFQVTAYRRHKIALHLPAYIIVYDYYNSVQQHFGIKQYEGKVLQLCDICEDEDCETLSCGHSSK